MDYLAEVGNDIAKVLRMATGMTAEALPPATIARDG